MISSIIFNHYTAKKPEVYIFKKINILYFILLSLLPQFLVQKVEPLVRVRLLIANQVLLIVIVVCSSLLFIFIVYCCC